MKEVCSNFLDADVADWCKEGKKKCIGQVVCCPDPRKSPMKTVPLENSASSPVVRIVIQTR